jgi:CHAT domain-containing protein
MVYAQHRNSWLTSLYGKIGANLQQSRRREVASLDRFQLQQFSARANVTLTLLTQNLLAQSRVAEGLEALTRARQEEYLNDNPNAAQALLQAIRPLEYAPKEKAWMQREVEAATRLKRLRVQAQAAGTGQAYAQHALGTGRHAYTVLLQRMEQAFSPSGFYDRKVWTLQSAPELTSVQHALRQIGRGTCAVYFLVAPDRLFRVLVTPERALVRIAGARHSHVEALTEAFRTRLLDPAQETRAAGKELYDLLFVELETLVASRCNAVQVRPVKDTAIEDELRRSRCRTLLVAADGPLRSVPFAALSPDGRTYLVQKYATAYFTPGSNLRLEAPATPVSARCALAAAVTREHPPFQALIAAEEEIEGIARGSDPQSRAQFPGKRLLDEQFTRRSLLTELERIPRKYTILHISSHFELNLSQEDSRLLLGDGSFWSLDEIRNTPTALFSGIELITLSACDTATIRATTGGRELENFSILAQRKGATSVLGSVWPVNSSSTTQLLLGFYSKWQGNVGKAEALQSAMLEAVPDHPYYWAGFLLFGNSR